MNPALDLFTRLLVWGAVGFFIWWALRKFISDKFLTWFGGAVILTLIVLSFTDPNDQTIGAIWQLISFPLMPLGATTVLLFSAMSPDLKKVEGRRVALALSILVISSVPLVAKTLVNQAEQSVENAYSQQQAACANICPAVDDVDVPLGQVVAVVVTAPNVDRQVQPDAFPSQLDATGELETNVVSRLNSATQAYDRVSGNDPIVLVTAGAINPDSETAAGQELAIRQRLINNGVPPARIEILNSGTDMHETATDVKAFLQAQNLIEDPPTAPVREQVRVLLVAPALAMRRAALTFEHMDVQVVAWPTDIFSGNGNIEPAVDTAARLADLVPSVEALRLTTRYWEELLTSIYYFLRGWLPGFNVQWEDVVETVRILPLPDETF